MSSHDELVLRLELLARKAAGLRSKALLLLADEDDDSTLWMSSLDIIDELLNEITEQIPTAEHLHPSVLPTATRCPNCQAAVVLTPETALAAAAICSNCGQPILLANPT